MAFYLQTNDTLKHYLYLSADSGAVQQYSEWSDKNKATPFVNQAKAVLWAEALFGRYWQKQVRVVEEED